MNDFLSKNRTQLMGYAILMVLVYHYGCWVHNFFGDYNVGFVGVDIFMFLSGWGLVFSYHKSKSVKEFYKKRAVRILPTFFLMYFIIIAYKIISPNLHESSLSIILELTTLSYWLQTDPNPTDWFLNCIIGFYFIFPILIKKISLPLCLFTTICVVLFDITTHVRWDLASGIDRLPIFAFGILCSVKNYSNKTAMLYCALICLLYIPMYKYVNERLALSFLMYVCMYVCSRIQLRKINIIEWMGKHSLSLYAANQVTFMFMSFTDRGFLIHSFAFIILQVLFTIMFLYNIRIVAKYIHLT